MHYFSPSLGGFFRSDVHGDNMPADSLPLTKEDYQALLAGQSAGKIIQPGASGFPILVDAAPRAMTREMIEESRLRAYADPLVGSDRYFAEAQRESLLGNAEAAEAAKALGLARFAEIQAEYPWPAE